MSINIQNSHQMPPRPMHVFVYGAPRCWKTTFASTFPNPLFLSAGNEGGDTTLQFVPNNCRVQRIDSVKDMMDIVPYVKANWQSLGIKTLVIDSITYYSDIVIHEILFDGNKRRVAMDPKDWGTLDSHIQKW